MPESKKKLRAIDLYSGVGGWSLGLGMAGLEVVASYERLGAANQTNFKNNHHSAQTVDIRNLSLKDLPSNIDVVVGSPPCTQFSFSNRGGGGDIADGMQDIIKFLSIVDRLKPRVWMMENVPRVEKILATELKKGGRLYRFRHLGTSKNGPVIDLLSMAPDVSWVRRGLVSAISGFLPPDAQVGA